MNLDELARSLNAFEKVDISPYQRRARILQSIWREEQNLPCGAHVGPTGSRPLGSRLQMPGAKDTLANFLTENIRKVVCEEVLDPDRSAGKLYSKPRIFNDLLSSQPLCFNLFGELRYDIPLLSQVVNELTNGRFAKLVKIEFEHSPGRGDPKYTADSSAFDVFLECETSAGKLGFIGIEVKYHENLRGPASKHKARYDEIAKQMGCFRAGAREELKKSPLQQIWRDHLLAGATTKADNYEDGIFVVLYPKDNEHVRNAVEAYNGCLASTDSFAAWTMEDFVGQLKQRSSVPWIGQFVNRYLAFEKIASRLGE